MLGFRMIKMFGLLCFMCLFFQTSKAQNAATPGPEIPKIIPPSPNAAALEKFGVIPVDYSTGIPNISYPMWSWHRGRLSFSLGLSYHAGGHKVEDMASNTGLGWTLSGLGRITRTVRGLPDDHTGMGFMYTPVLPQATTYMYDSGYYYTSVILWDQQNFPSNEAITSAGNVPYSHTIKSISESGLDGEQDMFSYSIPGYSGRFLFDKEKNIIPLEHTNIKIIPTLNASFPSGTIRAFRIVDDKGINYLFEQLEVQTSETISDAQTIGGPPPLICVSGWLLTAVSDPTTGDEITLSYQTSQSSLTPPKYETGFSQSQVINMETPSDDEQVSFPGISIGSDVHSYMVVSGNDPLPTQVLFPDGSKLLFEYTFPRADFTYTNALSKVVVKNYREDIVKQFSLSYSYFSTSATAVYPFMSNNDFSKRLRLDKVDELSADGLQHKPTHFQYNAQVLNARHSRNIDFWGYNVNPARGNWSLIPLVKLRPLEQLIVPYYGSLFVGEADRRPDADYVKAGVLERIVYPTGGQTDFEYECNKAFSEIDYYENNLLTNTPEWYQNQFSQGMDLLLVGRNQTKVELRFKAHEFDPRPTPDPNSPQSCLTSSQDSQPVAFEVYSTDGLFSTTVNETYEHLVGGTGTVIDLPLNKTYKIKFIYDANANCAFTYPFKTTAQGTYYIKLQDKLAGGVRVKKITSLDGSGKTVVKEYSYQNTSGNSSATLNVIPNYDYYRTTWDATCWSCSTHVFRNWYVRQINLTSSPNATLNYFNGSPLVYSRVTEKEVDASETERQYDPLVYIMGGYGNKYPFLPGQDFPNLSGLLTKTIIRDKFGNTKTEEDITYNKVQQYLGTGPNNRNVKVGRIASARDYTGIYYVADQYFKYTSRAEETSRTTKYYENGLEYSQTTNKTYHTNPYYLYREETTNSKQETRSVDHIYTFQGAGPLYDYMREKNMLGYPLQTRRGKGSGANNVLSTQWTNYSFWNNGASPLPANVQSSIKQNSPETDLTFDHYDDKGNILQYTARDGVITSFLWGYNKQYPVAKVVGFTHDAINAVVSTTVLNNPSSDAALRANLNNLRGLTGGLVTTYTYKPLVGATSETDPNGKTIYYEYDGFNRLSLIRDKDNNIVKRFCYKYDGQPVDCNGLNYENKPLSATYTKSCGSGFTTQPVTYVVPAGKYTSAVSQADADQQAQADLTANGQVWTNQNGVCTPIPACTTSNCTGADKKCVNGVCETGTKVCTSITSAGPRGSWVTIYHYEWSDGTRSPDYTENAYGCFIQ